MPMKTAGVIARTGMIARLTVDARAVRRVALRFVRHNENNETLLRTPREEPEAMRELVERSAPFGTRISVEGDDAVVDGVDGVDFGEAGGAAEGAVAFDIGLGRSVEGGVGEDEAAAGAQHAVCLG